MGDSIADLSDFDFVSGDAAETAVQPEQEAARWRVLELIEAEAPEVLRDLSRAPLAAYRSFTAECMAGSTPEAIEAFKGLRGPPVVEQAEALPWQTELRAWARRRNLEAQWVARHAAATLEAWVDWPDPKPGESLRWARPVGGPRPKDQGWHYPRVRFELELPADAPRLDKGGYANTKALIAAWKKDALRRVHEHAEQLKAEHGQKRPDLLGHGIEPWVYTAFVRYQLCGTEAPKVAGDKGLMPARLSKNEQQMPPDQLRGRMQSLVDFLGGPALRHGTPGRPKPS